MVDCSEVFVGMDVSKDRHAVAVADGGRNGEVRFHGEIGSDDASVRRLVRKLERSGARLRFCPALETDARCPAAVTRRRRGMKGAGPTGRRAGRVPVSGRPGKPADPCYYWKRQEDFPCP